MKKHRTFLLSIFIISVWYIILTPAVVTATDYNVTDLGFNCAPYMGINDYAQIVGQKSSTDQAFLWDNGVVTDLGTLPGLSWSYAIAINNNGEVTGNVDDSSFSGFIWDSTDGMRSFGVTLPWGNYTAVNNINNSGQVVGFGDGSDFEQHAFIWEEGVGIIDIGPGDDEFSEAYDINDSGQVTGGALFGGDNPSTFLWEAGTGMTNIGIEITDYFQGIYNEGLAINNLGQVVGEAYNSDGVSRGFMWDNGVVTDLGILPEGGFSEAFDINDSGQIVGYSTNIEGLSCAVLWKNGQIIDLNEYMPIEYSDWYLSMAVGINNNGQIIASGYGPWYMEGEEWYQDTHGFLFTPLGNGVIPEPASLLLLGFGVIGIAVFKRRIS